MPELVGKECGILVPVEQGWKRDLPGDPKALADGVEQVMKNRPAMSKAARSHAVKTFQVGAWLERHREILLEVTSR
jgi:glycosyltransferase involved in cell wall biosynthesis